MALTLRSSAFTDGQRIPRGHTEDGDDQSPALAWDESPAGAREYALIVDDPDAPTEEPFVHWVLYRIPPEIDGLPAAIRPGNETETPPGCAQGPNSFGRFGYAGPAPPEGHGPHRYRFRLFALDAPLDAKPGLEKNDLLSMMDNHIIEEALLVGVYER